MWGECAAEWGQGPGFKMRVAARLEHWFVHQADLEETLEALVNSLWEQTVLAPLMRLIEENAPAAETVAGSLVPFRQMLPSRAA